MKLKKPIAKFKPGESKAIASAGKLNPVNVKKTKPKSKTKKDGK